MNVLWIALLALPGCGKAEGETYDGCVRDDGWRDPIDVSSGSASVVVTTGCDFDLEVTDVELKGAGFDADLPEIGDLISEDTWRIDVYFDTELAQEPGTYSGVLYIYADNLMDDSLPKDLVAVVE
jgi:hypothetical protein